MSDAYAEQAQDLLAAFHAGETAAKDLFRSRHPRFLDPVYPWVQIPTTDEQLQAAGLTIDDAQLALARHYHFRDWQALQHFALEMSEGGTMLRFEEAVDAVVSGDLPSLRHLLDNVPELVRLRSTRVTEFDPPVHGAMLLHYVAANGVEGYRQRTPANAVEVARLLLDAGADPNAPAWLYGGDARTLYLLLSSCHPAKAGLQVALAAVLLDYGADINGDPATPLRSPLMTALTFGYPATAEMLAQGGARLGLVELAGLGRTAEVEIELVEAPGDDRHRALAVAALLGRSEVVKALLDAGEDPNRFNPEGFHSHSTPLHQAIAAGHLEVVKLLVERGARTDIEDTIYHGTGLGWAEHLEKTEIAAYLREMQ